MPPRPSALPARLRVAATRHCSRRLASTSASRPGAPVPPPALAPSHLSFPPPQAKSDPFFDPAAWAALQPPPSSALSAFAHRVGLGRTLTDPASTLTALTHPSFLPVWARANPRQTLPESNGNLEALGNSLLGLFAAEWIHATYPHLPTRVLKAAVSAYVGPTTCAALAKEMGAAQLLRWNRTPATATRDSVLHSDALASVPRALTALVFSHHSLSKARKWAHAFFFSRDVDLRPMLKFTDPKKALQDTVFKFGRERPVSRLLKETGRFSNSPVFVVGIYSGADELGQGFGSSLKMAEYRAAEDALHRLYLTRTPAGAVALPTSTFPETPGGLFDAETLAAMGAAAGAGAYVAPALGEQEVLYASAGRSRIVANGSSA